MKKQNWALLVSTMVLATAACGTSTGTGESTAAPASMEAPVGLASLDVIVTAEIAKGDVRLSLFKGADAYNGGAPVGGRAIDVSSGTGTATFTGLEPGKYAIRAFHDLNGNSTLDTNALGLPSEPFAFSNNAPANFGPAKFDAAAFDVTAGANTHRMNIR